MRIPAFSSLLLLSLFSEGHAALPVSIGVSNGGQWGTWGNKEFCLPGYVAKGFAFKVQESQGSGDDTGLNGIRLYCVNLMNNRDQMTISSTVGLRGSWSATSWCPSGNLAAFNLKVLSPQRAGDDIAATRIKFRCSDLVEIESAGLLVGSYRSWSNTCLNSICGIVTKVQPDMGASDDTALNDVKFICC
ncbi:vitelline membrane outer layer protein 1 homolog [Bombina bombina]|uniref:vitelline membrane outer layer protein 1 homolog n=1 Tax=Bombina bombina TaxID=8345 RepID=UPI00235A7A2B|nr:vitelline membrane outer layer protein 1 homolog [Bombina bombina]